MSYNRLYFLVLVFWSFYMSVDSQTLPELKKEDDKYTLIVDEEPYLILGGQLWNSSAWPEITDKFWEQAKDLGVNTIELPIYWQNIEPKPGVYNFEELEQIVISARENNIRLVLLWFGSYKNGRSQYAPPWVLNNPDKYPRMKNSAGDEIYVLSAISKTNLSADIKAFVEVMKFLKKIDGEDQTVIMMQVENEPGSMWTDRDYSETANKLFNENVPDTLVAKLGNCEGTWSQVFGVEAAEAFNAFYISRYIDQIAAAGKSVYDLPMYANVWIRENAFQRPGEYPSGGPTSNMLDLWKITAPNLDLLALDVYHGNYKVFTELCSKYERSDNALFIPEMGKGNNFARFQFYAIGNYNAIGVANYGVDPFHLDPHDQRDKHNLDNKFKSIKENYRLLSRAVYPITKLQGTGQLYAGGQEAGLSEQLISLENYDLLLRYGYPTYLNNEERNGRVIVGQIGEDEFLLIGFDTKFEFRPKYGSGYDKAEYILVEEGRFDGAKWEKSRIWNGDALYHATLPHDGAILKIKLRRIKGGLDKYEKANFDK